MKRIVKWTVLVAIALAACGFVAFLYFIPPMTSTAPEEFVSGEAAATPTVDSIADPAERTLAERGRYLILTNNCTGCHLTQGPKGPMPDMYLAGGMRFITNTHGSVVSRNLTPDRDTGLGARTDDDVKRVLRSGTYPDGRSISHRAMPWSAFSNWTDEDLHAVVVFLRHIKPVRHAIPPATAGQADASVPGALEVSYAQDAGKK